MKDIELPPLPECRDLSPFSGSRVLGYWEVDMHSYARAAVEADRADRAQRVPDDQAIRAALRSALARGRVCGEVIPAHQWDDMREAQIEQAIQLLASTPAQPAPQPVERKPMTIRARIFELIVEHGSLRAVANATEIDVAYLSRLQSGEKANPKTDVLSRLGLVKVVGYERHHGIRE